MAAESHVNTLEGNEAVADVAYRLNDVICIYPITPSSAMGEYADVWASHRRPNIWGNVPSVTEMQSEGGAAGAIHGALQGGALATTFTASQGLLLMIPNMYKIAGELTPFVMHVAARTVATHALSIFGDHSDVMACRQTGFAMLAAANAQQAHDFACIAQAASLESRIPFLHFFDGFRTSHEINKVHMLTDGQLAVMMQPRALKAHHARGLTPDRPSIRGTAQNPDTFFQAREACNPYYDACPLIVAHTMDHFAAYAGRRYAPFAYEGAPDAERVIVIMGSAAETAASAAAVLNQAGERVGVLTVHLYRPFSLDHFLAALPASVRRIAVLDRTKEPGALGEPLLLDVIAALHEAAADHRHPAADALVIGGRYGLSSKEFTPAMVKAVFDELDRERPRRRFTVGIVDDVTRLSLDYDPAFTIEDVQVKRAVFYGLGSDGTVGANKNTIKILGADPARHVQGYFVYDSKKSGAMTVSHLRFSPKPIRSPYLIDQASFVACHHFPFLERVDVLHCAEPGAAVLLNAPYGPDELWDRLPRAVQELVIEKGLRLYGVDAGAIARSFGLKGRINTIMQACYFKIAEVAPLEESLMQMEQAIRETYRKKGDEIVERNCRALRAAVDSLYEVRVPDAPTASPAPAHSVFDEAPDFVQRVTAAILAGQGDRLPVSAFPVDGVWPTGTARYEKRGIAESVPVWDPGVCIQCNKCAFVCPHAAIRATIFEPAAEAAAPEGWRSTAFKSKEAPGMRYAIQVAPDDCTGCGLCVQICPAKDKANPRHKAIDMTALGPIRDRERENFAHFIAIPPPSREAHDHFDVKTSQFLEPLFEFSGACAGCGETPYIKLLTQLYGDRAVIANATGCSSIYGGNLPTTPYCANAEGRGPAWANSLFEDNAEFGLGIRLALDAQRHEAQRLLRALAGDVGEELAAALLDAPLRSERDIAEQRRRVETLKTSLSGRSGDAAHRLLALADALVRKQVWIVGGDGWAFDIGYGGLDHVLSTHHDVNILVLDTEVYSNTGGQASKATPIGAAAKFASLGKSVDKKDLGLMAMNYGHVYVASVAFGAKDVQTVRAFQEAAEYDGPSLIIAYSHCIAHGYDLAFGADQQAKAVQSGVWPLYRYNPRALDAGESPLTLDGRPGKTSVAEYMGNEARFRMVERADPEQYQKYQRQAAEAARRRIALYDHLAALRMPVAADAAQTTKEG